MNAHPAPDNDVRVRDFLADSLALWRVAGTVDAGELPTVAVIRAGSGAIICVERPLEEGMPFRWLVRARGAGSARPCASLVGLLNAVRNALDVDRGGALRIAPAPADE